MDEHSSERFRKSNAITFNCVKKTGALATVKPGLMAGRQAGWQVSEYSLVADVGFTSFT